MKIHLVKTMLKYFLIVFVAVLCINSSACQAAPERSMNDAEQKYKVIIDQALKTRDPAVADQVVAILKLQPPPVSYITFEAAHAAAMFGATAALQPMHAIANVDPKAPIICHYVAVQEARLVAESTKGSATQKIAAFYQQLGMSPSAINVDILVNDADDDPHSRSVGRYALQELADFIYHSGDAACLTMADIKELDFSVDPQAALLMRLAPLTGDQRIAAIMDDLANEKEKLHHYPCK